MTVSARLRVTSVLVGLVDLMVFGILNIFVVENKKGIHRFFLNISDIVNAPSLRK